MFQTAESPTARDVLALLRSGDWHALRRALAGLHPADVAELVDSVDADEEMVLFRLVGRRKADVFAYLAPHRQRRILRTLEPEQLSGIVGQMPADDRTRLLAALPEDVQHTLLGRLPPSEVKQSLALLGYPEDTAGRYMTPNYVAIPPGMTAGEALDHIRRTGRGKETLNVVYIVDDQGRLVEDIRLGALVLADPATKVDEIADPAMVALQDTTPVEEVLHAFEKYDRVAIPVTDRMGLMLGIITIDDVLDVAERQSTRDIHKLGGLDALDVPYADVGFWSMVRKRGGWLAVLFVGEMLTATAMGFFEAEIARAVVLALFVPLIISSGGNSGSQAASLIIRSLALQELRLRDWLRVFNREIWSGVVLGAGLGAIGFSRIVLWQHFRFANYGPHYFKVGITVWLSLVGVVTFGTLAGSMLPFLMRRLGFDPATSSSPFVATLVDVTGLVIYFQVAAALLRGTLL
jgi:magnesium transporter